MIIMTDGLHALAGNAIRTALMRFTRSPTTGAITGAASTAILQSSSATTVAVVGFVGTGLMSFPAALGIIFGANIGTTVTGWLVALLGFTFHLGNLVFPLIFIGAVLKLFARGRLAASGYSLAGLGVIFVGIATLQQGMSGLESMISFEDLPADSFGARLELVFLGIVFTLITQSSSAGVATTLTALFTGIIHFEQAAALVIGMDIGTTVTAMLATIGGSVNARRTGFSHVIYNLFTGAGALLLISPYILLWESLAPGALQHNSEIALVAFHTSFNIVGVSVAIIFTRHFVQLIERLFPEKPKPYKQPLDHSLLSQPSLALNAVQKIIYEEILAMFNHIRAVLSEDRNGERMDIIELKEVLDRTHYYIEQIHLSPREQVDWERLVNIIHTLDHMQRLHERCEEEEDRAIRARSTELLIEHSQHLLTATSTIVEHLQAEQWHDAAITAEQIAYEILEHKEPLRESIMSRLAQGEISVSEATPTLESIRWLERVSQHLARITHHYSQALLAAGK
jgi:phosphate:Na+ symporter